ncbi:glycerophosphodiester phosphodiesterase family protein [Motiliproteus sp. SC1-56]|uniref:glycerophosphodiester phosphodiesterase n=1 Tax=Motiliproteus sp. SC1-56 TaxID=2799565 RepID=UPI001A8E1198|nr:glycerophosphodiester phosphodiesterase family protein [Motiliproteus sp. SC1-56]
MLKRIAHRFFPSIHPENSLSGIKFCAENNAWAIETDIQLTRDNVPVLMHDKLLDRTTNQKGFVKDYDYKALDETCRLSNGEKVPTLYDLFDNLRDKRTRMYLELIDQRALGATLDAIEKYGIEDRCIISSFHHSTLLEAKRQNPAQATMALFECCPIDPLHLVNACKANQAGIGFDSVCAHTINTLKAGGIEVYAWTVNNRSEIRLAEALGLHGIFTDEV